MTDRRETPRARNRRARPNRPSSGSRPERTDDWSAGERIAKYLARAGVASRREAEALIEQGAVRVNGQRLRSPAFKVRGHERIEVHGKLITPPDPIRLWRYHKPAGLITTTQDPEGRTTIFDQLPKSLPRVITIGRLDLTTEGLLLLTSDGGLARHLELPATGMERRYRARAHGEVSQEQLDTLKQGITLKDGTRFARIEAELERQTGANNWISVKLIEGQNREVRRAMEHLGLQVNRLIRTDYGPFDLSGLSPGSVEEIPAEQAQAQLQEKVDASLLPQAETPKKRTAPRSKAALRSRLSKPR